MSAFARSAMDFPLRLAMPYPSRHTSCPNRDTINEQAFGSAYAKSRPGTKFTWIASWSEPFPRLMWLLELRTGSVPA